VATLGDVAKLVRSKNAGRFWLTIDIMFGDVEAYRRARDADIAQPRRHCPPLQPQAGRLHRRQSRRCPSDQSELYKGDQLPMGPMHRTRQHLVEQQANRHYRIEDGPLGVAADVVALAHSALAENREQGTGVILHIEASLGYCRPCRRSESPPRAAFSKL
jgi:hypothetical protein